MSSRVRPFDELHAPSVLIVEPDTAERGALCRMVRGLGYGVCTARDGREALQLVNDHPGRIRAVIAALLAPRMDGGELAERLRGSGTRVALMADEHPSPEAGELLAAYPNLPVLRKPVTLNALYGVLAVELGTPPAVGAAAPKSRQARRSSERRAIP